jgi:hypothetical protein
MLDGLFALLFGALEAFTLGVPYASAEAKRSARTKAENQFRAHRVAGAEGSVVFVGALAQPLRTDETYTTSNGRVIDYVLTLFVVTPTNHYFLFKSNPSGRPYLKELAAERARLVLKDKFRRYAASDA